MSLKSVTQSTLGAVKFLLSVVLNVYFILAVLVYLGLCNTINKFTATEGPYKTTVPENAVISLTLHGDEIGEYASYGTSSNRLNSLFGGGGTRFTSYSFTELMNALRKVPEDNRVKGVVVKVFSTQYNAAQVYEIQKALREIRDVGKTVYVYVDGYMTNNELLLGSAANERWVAPDTFIRPVRPIYGASYLKGFYDKFNIDFIGQRMALYKDFIQSSVKYQVDQDTKSTFDTHYRQYEDLMNLVANNYGRPVSDFDLSDKELLDTFKSTGGNLTKAFTNKGYVNGVKTEGDFDQYVAETIASTEDDPSFPNYFSLNDYTNALEQPLFNQGAKDQKHIAFLVLSGDVVRHGFKGVISLDNTVRYLREIYYNANKVAALVVRIDSPGGSTATSETVKSAMQDILGKNIPIVVSQGNLAASAGYQISSTSNYIFSTPLTTTGSIGVVIGGTNVSRMLEKFGVRADTQGVEYYFGSNTFGIPGFIEQSYANPYPDMEANVFKAMITQNYKSFIESVYQGRKKHFANVEGVHKVAQGHVWGATDAKELGLVDAFGNAVDAIEKAKELYLFGQNERKTDEFSPGKFEVTKAEDVANLPVVFYNAERKSNPRLSVVSVLNSSEKEPQTTPVVASFLEALDLMTGNTLSSIANHVADIQSKALNDTSVELKAKYEDARELLTPSR